MCPSGVSRDKAKRDLYIRLISIRQEARLKMNSYAAPRMFNVFTSLSHELYQVIACLFCVYSSILLLFSGTK